MTSIFRLGLCRLTNRLGPNSSEAKVIFRGIAGRELRCIRGEKKKPAPWPYHTKKYTLLNYIYDKTTKRFDENSKIVVVEGPVAAGKTKFAKELADELGMLYLPEANIDMFFTNFYGYNIKCLDPEIPEACRSFDVQDFLKNPKHRRAASFQFLQYSVKYSQYIDALAHVMSTGQGVVLDRCVYSDFVFAEAMYKHKYMSKIALSAYYELRQNTVCQLLRPHLVIYLDVPVDKVMQKIKNRNIGVEATSPAMTCEYLRSMEDAYKQNYLREISKHAEMLVYDWSEEAEVEVVVEDIERIDFTRYDTHDPRMKDWVHRLEEEWAVLRHKYADKKDFLLNYLDIPFVDVPELVTDAGDALEYRRAIEDAPGNRYQTGYNIDMGDSGLIFKYKNMPRSTLPLIERELC